MEFTFLSIYFSLQIKKEIIKKVLRFSIAPFAIFCAYDFLTTTKPSFAFMPLVIECLFFLVIIIYSLYEKMLYNIEEPIFILSSFWISVGFIVYCSGNFFLFLYSKNSYNDINFRIQYSIIYSTVTILKNILLCIGVSRKREEVKKAPEFPFTSDLDNFYPFNK